MSALDQGSGWLPRQSRSPRQSPLRLSPGALGRARAARAAGAAPCVGRNRLPLRRVRDRDRRRYRGRLDRPDRFGADRLIEASPGSSCSGSSPARGRLAGGRTASPAADRGELLRPRRLRRGRVDPHLAGGQHPEASWVGIGLAAFTAMTMPLLARVKRRVGHKLARPRRSRRHRRPALRLPLDRAAHRPPRERCRAAGGGPIPPPRSSSRPSPSRKDARAGGARAARRLLLTEHARPPPPLGVVSVQPSPSA